LNKEPTISVIKASIINGIFVATKPLKSGWFCLSLGFAINLKEQVYSARTDHYTRSTRTQP
jgi:hypothetical protein